jgi:hypothetical protein
MFPIFGADENIVTWRSLPVFFDTFASARRIGQPKFAVTSNYPYR